MYRMFSRCRAVPSPGIPFAPKFKPAPNPCEMNTSTISPFNSFRIRTSEIIGLKVLWNEHFHKNPGGWGLETTVGASALVQALSGWRKDAGRSGVAK